MNDELWKQWEHNPENRFDLQTEYKNKSPNRQFVWNVLVAQTSLNRS